MKLRDIVVLTGSVPMLFGFAACNGGSGASVQPAFPVASAVAAPDATNAVGARRVALAYSAALATKAGSTIPLMYRGKTVGRLKATSHILIGSVTGGIPNGAMLLAKGQKVEASFPLARTGKNTAVMVAGNPNGTLRVTTASGLKPTSTPSANDPNGTVETEDSDGNVTKIKLSDGGLLPTGLPFSIALTCTTMTLAPNAGETFSGIEFEENVDGGGGGDGSGGSGGSGNGGFEYKGAFDGPLAVPLIANSTAKLKLFQSDQDILEIEAPIASFGTPTGATPCPSAAPSASPSAEPSDSPEPSQSPEPSESPR